MQTSKPPAKWHLDYNGELIKLPVTPVAQSRRGSLIEATLSTAFGFLLALVIWRYVIRPIWGIDATGTDDIMITVIFTAVSIVRQFITRRVAERLRCGKS